MSHPYGGGSAINLEYTALLNLGGVSEAQVRQVIRCNAALRKALRDALAQLPGVRDAEQCPALTMAAQLARGEHGKPSAEALFAGLCDAARARVVKGADLPSSIKSWAQLSKRAAEYKTELLISTLVHAEHNAEAAAQQPEQLAQTELQYARLSERGKLLVTGKATTFGQAAVQWPELLRYAVARGEVADLAALVGLQYAKEGAAEAKRAAAALKAQANTPDTPLPPKAADPRARRTSKNHYKRRASVGKV